MWGCIGSDSGYDIAPDSGPKGSSPTNTTGYYTMMVCKRDI